MLGLGCNGEHAGGGVWAMEALNTRISKVRQAWQPYTVKLRATQLAKPTSCCRAQALPCRLRQRAARSTPVEHNTNALRWCVCTLGHQWVVPARIRMLTRCIPCVHTRNTSARPHNCTQPGVTHVIEYSSQSGSRVWAPPTRQHL
jgi:hypothetical protein